ncbi:hypothetical protein [Ruegeria atlantica]|uniref:hypothetical protein n=1 Tax=Ruegeria atlantica TaxID=81569 RepID=UPI0014816E16|nr:hypothetical protein [Ruegeria atlantica]
MTGANEDWWHARIPDGEAVLWAGRPDQGYFPPRFAWAYKGMLVLFATLWLASPWLFDTVRDFWKLFFCTIGFWFVLWADRFARSQRVYVVTKENAWKLNKDLKSKSLKIDRFLNFRSGRRAVLFSRHPFFAFEHLSDPDAALAALHQAQEASK